MDQLQFDQLIDDAVSALRKGMLTNHMINVIGLQSGHIYRGYNVTLQNCSCDRIADRLREQKQVLLASKARVRETV